MEVKSRFDKSAAEWDNNPVRVELARAVGAVIARAIPLQPNWRALDYGAGTGLLTLNLQPHVASLLAMDSSAGMLKMLKKKLAAAGISNVATRQWNLASQPFPEAGFDLAVSSMTFHHILDVPLVLKRLAALLKPEGWLAFADLDAEDGSFHGVTNDVFHHGFDRSQIANWLTDAGFVRVAVSDAHVMTKPSSRGPLRNYGVFMAVGQRS